MNWERYYEEKKVVPFTEQSASYGYILDNFGDYLIGNLDGEIPVAVLGGMNPSATKPENFEKLCKSFLGKCQTIVVDQNEFALTSVANTESTPLLSGLENLPQELKNVSLMICDFTFDFMTDEQVKMFDATWQLHCRSNNLLFISLDCPAIPFAAAWQYKRQYGLDMHYRTAEKLAKLMPNHKAVIRAVTGKETELLVLASKESSLAHWEGESCLITSDSDRFAKWLGENQGKF